MPGRPFQESRSLSGCLSRAGGLIALIGSFGVGIVGWLVLLILHNDLQRAPDHAQRIKPFALWLIEHRAIVPISAVPIAIFGLWMQFRPAAGTRWVDFAFSALATLWLVGVFIAVLVAFIQFIMPLYQYQPV